MRSSKINSSKDQVSPKEHEGSPYVGLGALYPISIALVFGILHCQYVDHLFENDRHFSHLSDLEREMTFRSEMGLYYSYYKTLVEAPTFMQGLEQIMSDNLTEYPNKINTLRRFNLSPEVIIAFLYNRYIDLTQYYDIPTRICWQVERGNNLPAVLSCEGTGVPIYFYLNIVWTFAGITVMVLFLYGTEISGSMLGGLLTVTCYMFNHRECTRVHWTPSLRESFGYPILLLQMYAVTKCLSHNYVTWTWRLCVNLCTAFSILFWQFSQFVILGQVGILYFMFAIGVMGMEVLAPTLFAIMAGVLYSCVILLGNEMLVTSFLSCFLLIVVLSLFLWDHILEKYLSTYNCAIARLGLTAGLTLFIKGAAVNWLGAKDDAHIFHLLLSKFHFYRDFHTLLYTCSAEFDFIQLPQYLYHTSLTLLIPVVAIALSVPLSTGFCGVALPPKEEVTEGDKGVKKSEPYKMAVKCRDVDLRVMYNVMQMCVFVAMAVLVMRLKLFCTPHLGIVAALVASKRFSIFRPRVHWVMVAIVLAGMGIKGAQNINDELSIAGEYSDPSLEELIDWIKSSTPPNAVFAGPMPTMANVLLSTRRPIVNHPHYEDAELRERTKKVYSMFSRRSAQDVYKTMAALHVNYLVIHEANCLWRSNRSNCTMVELWDVEEPSNLHRLPLCPQLFKGNPSPFEKVFFNDEYVVLRLPTQVVELKPKQFSL